MASNNAVITATGWQAVPGLTGEKKINLIPSNTAGMGYAVKSATPVGVDGHPAIFGHPHPVDILTGEQLYVYGPCVVIWTEAL